MMKARKGKGDDALDSLKNEQREIERRMRELEVREAELEKQETLRRAKADHAQRMREYRRMMDEQEAAAGALAHPPAVPSEAEADAMRQALAAKSVNAAAELQKYRDKYKTKRASALAPQPFSFTEREGETQLSIRARRQMEEEAARREKETANLAYPHGSYEIRAATVPPDTFINKLELMTIEGEERRRQRTEKARAAWVSDQPEQAITDAPRYVSEPLTRRERYVPVAEQMGKYKFKSKPVPKSVKEPRWGKIVEAEILRKMDVKEAARYKLAEFERDFPKAASRTASSGPSRRSRSVPALPEDCRFKPEIKGNVPDFSKHRAQEVLKQYKKPPPKTTTPAAFKLSGARAKPAAEVQYEIQKDQATLPEDRWPYVSSRLPPQRRSPSRSKSVPPTRYTKAANILLLEKSMAIVRREESKKKDEEEQRERDKRRKLVAATLKRYDTVDWKDKKKGDDDEEEAEEAAWQTATRAYKAKRGAMQDRLRKQKPIWMRAPEGQAEDAAIRARVEEVAAQPGGSDGDADSDRDDRDDAPPPAARPTAAARPAASGSDDDSDSSSDKSDDDDDDDSYSD